MSQLLDIKSVYSLFKGLLLCRIQYNILWYLKGPFYLFDNLVNPVNVTVNVSLIQAGFTSSAKVWHCHDGSNGKGWPYQVV